MPNRWERGGNRAGRRHVTYTIAPGASGSSPYPLLGSDEAHATAVASARTEPRHRPWSAIRSRHFGVVAAVVTALTGLVTALYTINSGSPNPRSAAGKSGLAHAGHASRRHHRPQKHKLQTSHRAGRNGTRG